LSYGESKAGYGDVEGLAIEFFRRFGTRISLQNRKKRCRKRGRGRILGLNRRKSPELKGLKQ